jgi:hypothetical protein
MSSQSFCFPFSHDPSSQLPASEHPCLLLRATFSLPQTSLFMFLMIVDNMKHISLPSSRFFLFINVIPIAAVYLKLKNESAAQIFIVSSGGGEAEAKARRKKGQSRVALCFTRTSVSSREEKFVLIKIFPRFNQ